MHDPVIETLRLTRRYGSLVAVDDLSLRVPAGSIYAFLGANGAGKTTTIRMLLGLIRPDAGEVRLFGQPLAGSRLAALGRVGALVETPSLYGHLTGRENLEVTRRMLGAPRSRITRALEIVRLGADAHRPVRGYSLGMRQRLGLALALVPEPDLLVLDEPTNGLDPAGIHEMRDLIRRLPAEHGISVFLSSHLLAEVELLASHVGIIHRGRLLFQGALEALQAQRRASIRVDVDRPGEAAALLDRAGWSTRAAGNGRLLVDPDADAGEIARLLVLQGFSLSHLSREQPSLEQTFLAITGEPRIADLEHAEGEREDERMRG